MFCNMQNLRLRQEKVVLMAEFLDKTSLALLLYMEKHNGKMNQHEVCLISKEDFSHNSKNRYIENLKHRGLIEEHLLNSVSDGLFGTKSSGCTYSFSLGGESYLQELRRDQANQLLQSASDLLNSVSGLKF